MKQSRLPLALYKIAVQLSRGTLLTRVGIRDALRDAQVPLVADGAPRSADYVVEVIHYVATRVRERRTTRARLKAGWASRSGLYGPLPLGCPAFRLIHQRYVRNSPLMRLIDATDRARGRVSV